MLQIDPNTIWSIGDNHPHDLKEINSKEIKDSLSEYNWQAIQLILGMPNLEVSIFLSYHFNKDKCNKSLYIKFES